MQMILVILILLIIADWLFLMFYCRLRKRREEKYTRYKAVKSNEIKGENETLTEKKATKKTLKMIIAPKIDYIGESLLRLNIWFVGKVPSHFLRKMFYSRICCVRIGKNTVIHYGTEIRAPWNLIIGDGTIIGDNVILDARSGLEIGKNVNFSSGASIWTLQHDVQSATFSTENQGEKVIIEDRAWISTNAIVLPGVLIGEGAVIAAGEAVRKV